MHTDTSPAERGSRNGSGTRVRAAGYAHPDDVLEDAKLTQDQKREILASWLSDAHAVPDCPWLRQLASGFRVQARDIAEALKSLDGAGDRHRPLPRRSRPIHGGERPRRRMHDDDDPPPCAPAVAMPVPRALAGLAA